MNHPEQIAPIHAQVFDKQVAEIIARETGAPIELATRIYNEELRDLVRGARITQFVNVLAGRRARLKLQRRQSHRLDLVTDITNIGP
jgi:hypothetical protein